MSSGNKKKIVYVSAAVLVDGQGRVLLAKRPEGRKMAGLWEFPGGKIEPFETPEDALIRELKEELDIDVSRENLSPLTFASHDYDDFHLFMPVFICRVWGGAVSSKEAQEFEWVAPADFNRFPMPHADKPLIPFIEKALQ